MIYYRQKENIHLVPNILPPKKSQGKLHKKRGNLHGHLISSHEPEHQSPIVHYDHVLDYPCPQMSLKLFDMIQLS